MFQRNISPPSSRSKSKPSKKQEAGGKLRHMFQRNISPPSSRSRSKPSKKQEAGGKLDCYEDVLGS
jgi:hypothetical protein